MSGQNQQGKGYGKFNKLKIRELDNHGTHENHVSGKLSGSKLLRRKFTDYYSIKQKPPILQDGEDVRGIQRLKVEAISSLHCGWSKALKM